jgi:peptidoglycan/LPS O-acetylase OafA/YrhL
MQREIASLTGLRGVAAAWVFLFHCGDFLRHPLPQAAHALGFLGAAGYMGVDIFFVLSGFVLALNYTDAAVHRSPSSYMGFLWKRLARIYPVHIAALVLLVIVEGAFRLHGTHLLPRTRYSIEGLLRTLTLTHGWSIPIEKTWNTVSWSLSCEWGAYLAFPVLALMAQRLRSRAAVLTMLSLLLLALTMNLRQKSYFGSISYGVLRIAVEFPAGILLYQLWVLAGFPRTRAAGWLALVGLFVLIGAGNALATLFDSDMPFPWLPGAACLIVYGLAAGRGPLERWLSSPIALFAGRISFAFYMIHGILLGIPEQIIDAYGLHDATDVLMLLLLTSFAAVLLASSMYRWVETPARAAMLQWARRPREVEVAVARL